MFGHFPDALCVPFDGLQPLTQWKRKISVDFMQHPKLKMFRFKLVQIPLSSCLVLWNGLVGACQDTSSHPISLVFQPRLRIPPLPSENSPLNPWASENRPGSGNCFLVLRNENHKTCNQRFGIIFVLDPSHQKRAIALATIFGSKLTEKSQMRAMAAPNGARKLESVERCCRWKSQFSQEHFAGTRFYRVDTLTPFDLGEVWFLFLGGCSCCFRWKIT